MKKIIFIAFICALISSCEVIEEPYMNDVMVPVNPIDTVNPVDTTIYPQFLKNILIEDFTGHTCKNCPDAARTLDAIHDFYGSRIIGLALHVGSTFARPYPIDPVSNPDSQFIYDFRTKKGEEIDDFFEISENGLPKGMINRIDYTSGEHRKDFAQWSSLVADELSEDALFGLILNVDFDNNEYDISVSAIASSELSGDYKLVVCLAEDQIINWQKDGEDNDDSYIHKHVLRKIITPTFGDDLSNLPINIGDTLQHIYNDINLWDEEYSNITYSEFNLTGGNGNAGGWKSTNMNVVAYIYDASNYEILQVEQVPLLAK